MPNWVKAYLLSWLAVGGAVAIAGSGIYIVYYIVGGSFIAMVVTVIAVTHLFVSWIFFIVQFFPLDYSKQEPYTVTDSEQTEEMRSHD